MFCALAAAQDAEGFLLQVNNPKSPIEGEGGDAIVNLLSQCKAKLPTDRILTILRNSPSGLTAKEVAHRLGGTTSNIGSRLSKLAAYGVIKQSRSRIAQTASPCAVYSFPPSVGPSPAADLR
jgi:hypothetical protein